MSPEAQRIAIAEVRHPEHHLFFFLNEDGITGKCVRLGHIRDSLVERQIVFRDPLTDLNAMHEAEKTFLSGPHADKYTLYLNALEEVTNTVRVSTQQWDFMFATAAQRAEAFLRTLGKWEDGK